MASGRHRPEGYFPMESITRRLLFGLIPDVYGVSGTTHIRVLTAQGSDDLRHNTQLSLFVKEWIMNRIPVFVFLLVAFSAVQVPAAQYYVTPDEDTCWEPPNWCLEVDKTRWRDDNFLVRYRNICEHRLYVKYCNQKKDGSWSCGSTGIGGGRTSTWDTYNASGRYHYRFIGVLKGSNDWVCSGKVRGWNDDPR